MRPCPRGELLIFTTGGEWTTRAGGKSDVLTPSSIVITPYGYRGSAVCSAYGFEKDIEEAEIVAKLMGLYEGLAQR